MFSQRRRLVTLAVIAAATAVPLVSVAEPAQAASSICAAISTGRVHGLSSRPAHVTLALAAAYGSTHVTVTACSKTRTGAYTQVWRSPGRAGRNGFAAIGTKREGDGTSPTGVFTFGAAFGRSNPAAVKGYLTLRRNSCWGSSFSSTHRNRYFTGVCGKGDETMYNWVNTAYRQGLVINYNTTPARRGYGAAIFFHVATAGPTAGCISTDYSSVVKAIRTARPGDVIVQGVTSTMIAGAAGTRITHTLSIGSSYTAENRILQRRLTAVGYPVTADGVFGAKTRVAVMRFQTKKRLTADGIVGPIAGRALGIR